jgi:hypothetical protein
VATHRAAGRTKIRPPMSTGRLALWMIFTLFVLILVMATVLSLTGKGTQ